MNLSIKELNELIYSLGITASKGIFVNKELNASLIDKLYSELNSKIAIQSDITDEVIDRIKSHYVSNEEADEDFNMTYFNKMLKEENEYASSLGLDKPKKRGEGTAQSLLDYVDMKGAVSHKELHEYYKSLNGSNTFSWCLKNLRIPYKNRKTQRYLAKEGRKGSNAKWVVKMANPSNWVVIEY
jgi:hypothetical protein